MSRAFIAFYMGDYQKKTQHLDTLQHGAYFLLLQHCWTHGAIPMEPAGRAAIARLPLAVWKKNAAVINAFFDDEGRNKRATEEVEKAERVSLKRAMAGQKGGFKSGVSKSIAKGQQHRSKHEANAIDMLKQTAKQKATISEAIQNPSITKNLSGTAREGVDGKPLSSETNRLLDSLERIRQAKQSASPPPDPVEQGKVWVDYETEWWSAHAHYAKFKEIRMRLPIKRIDERGVEHTGAYFDKSVPDGYDEATGERIAPASEENAA